MIDYWKFGKGEKVLVILPGVALKSTIKQKDAIMKNYESFCDDYTIYLIDDRANVKPGYSIKNRADDVANFLKEEGVLGAYVWGASMGGMVSHHLAANYPELVKKLVNASTCIKLTDSTKAKLNKWLNLAKKETLLVLVLQMMSDIYSRDYIREYGQGIVEYCEDTSDEELDKFKILVKAIIDTDTTKEISKIKCPMLVCGSKNDRIFGPEPAIDIAKKTGAKLLMYEYEGYGHALYDEDPNFKDKIRDFFAK